MLIYLNISSQLIRLIVEQLEGIIQHYQQTQFANISTSYVNDLSNIKTNMSTFGARSPDLAVASLSWTGLRAVASTETFPGVNVQQCSAINSTYTNAQVIFLFETILASLLPLPFGGVTVIGNITCQPMFPTQILPYDPAFFAIPTLNITTLYTEFAAHASYVTFLGVNESSANQLSEGNAPLSYNFIQDMVQISLRSVVIPAVSNSISKRDFRLIMWLS